MAGPLIPIGLIDPFKGIPIVDPHLYGSAGSHFVLPSLIHLQISDSDDDSLGHKVILGRLVKVEVAQGEAQRA